MIKSDILDPDAFAQLVGMEIFFLRQSKSWTQEELGERCGLNKSVISRIERGGVATSLYDFHLICMTFDVLPERILPSFNRPKDT